jgi:hypothetical protein
VTIVVPKYVCNREHILRLIEHSRKNPLLWKQLSDERSHTHFFDARDKTILRYEDQLSWDGKILLDISNIITTNAYTVLDCIVCLFAYDDCAYMLDSHPGELEILAKFDNPYACLLYNACRILHGLEPMFQCSVSDND